MCLVRVTIFRNLTGKWGEALSRQSFYTIYASTGQYPIIWFQSCSSSQLFFGRWVRAVPAGRRFLVPPSVADVRFSKGMFRIYDRKYSLAQHAHEFSPMRSSENGKNAKFRVLNTTLSGIKKSGKKPIEEIASISMNYICFDELRQPPQSLNITEIRSALQLVYIRLCLRTIPLQAISGSSSDDITGMTVCAPFSDDRTPSLVPVGCYIVWLGNQEFLKLKVQMCENTYLFQNSANPEIYDRWIRLQVRFVIGIRRFSCVKTFALHQHAAGRKKSGFCFFSMEFLRVSDLRLYDRWRSLQAGFTRGISFGNDDFSLESLDPLNNQH
ncbi:hypothetical protein HUJ05_007437 [Dendroctonus ponderosae]|nr:hypothetical protein HUJ05_007437 [Dendroctonus ponderosae]